MTPLGSQLKTPDFFGHPQKRCQPAELFELPPHQAVSAIHVLLRSLPSYLVEAMTTRVPPLLEPYLALPPEASLILLTSVLGASTNWLVLRYLYSAFVPAASSGDNRRVRDGESGIGGIGHGDGTGNEDRKEGRVGDGAAVVLVSFLRDLSFWREGARKLVCLRRLFV